MNTTTLVIIVVVALIVVVAALVAFFVSRRRQQQQESARREFGPEYERVARERGSEKEAERELRERREEVGNRIRPLSDESRQRYEEEWEGVEKTFVDNPSDTVSRASCRDDRRGFGSRRCRNGEHEYSTANNSW